jgi:hypothetical protein
LQFHGDEHYEPDATVDASLFAAFYFAAFDAKDELVKNTMRAVEEKLWIKTILAAWRVLKTTVTCAYRTIRRATPGLSARLDGGVLHRPRRNVGRFTKGIRNFKLDGAARFAVRRFSRAGSPGDGRAGFGRAAHLVAFDVCGDGDKLSSQTQRI